MIFTVYSTASSEKFPHKILIVAPNSYQVTSTVTRPKTVHIINANVGSVAQQFSHRRVAVHFRSNHPAVAPLKIRFWF